MQLKSKDLLGIKELSVEEINLILETAETMKLVIMSKNKKTSHLVGRSIITLFYENSTRTRLSFELAAKFMSANAANISASSSSVSKGETLIDTGRTIDVMGTDVVIIRHEMSGAPHLLARNIKASVINAGDGMNEHPTQALLDIFTMKEKFGKIEGLNIAIVGDVLHSRVARSNIWGLKKLGANINVFGPTTLIPKGIEQLGVKNCSNLEEALKEADVVMGLRVQMERQNKGLFPSAREYAKFFGVDEGIIKFARPGAMIMHPGPVNRGMELSSGLVDSENSVIDEQVTNGVAIRMAILYLLMRRDA
ncbi:MAG: aspartate carbamoyltransferase catalytic subunit [Eubacteriales bacterium]